MNWTVGVIDDMKRLDDSATVIVSGVGIVVMRSSSYVERLFARTGFSFDKIDLVELNEAFAAQVLAVLKGWNWNDHDRLNVNGSGISLGHPIGATGVRMLTTLLYEMRRRGARYGLESMCIGGGQGMAAIFEAA